MKMKLMSILTIVLYVAFVSGCSSNDDSGDVNSPNSADQTAEIVKKGTWQIKKFIDSGTDETADFNGFVFTFNADGSLVANKNELTVTGTWSVTDGTDSSDDDAGSDDDDFNIFFDVPETNDFDDLSDDWDIVSVNNSKIELIDVSGGNGGTDNLVFEKL